MSQKSRRKKSRRHASLHSGPPTQTQTSDAITIAWTSSMTGVTVANLLAIAAYGYAWAMPAARGARALGAIMLVSAAAMGLISLCLVSLVLYMQRVKPPQGFLVYSLIVAAAPLVMLLLKLAQ